MSREQLVRNSNNRSEYFSRPIGIQDADFIELKSKNIVVDNTIDTNEIKTTTANISTANVTTANIVNASFIFK